jgi:eukaryotic-like serine/threonine-protein kinase
MTSSPDGKSLLYDTRDWVTKQDLWVASLSSQSKPIPFLRTIFNEGQGQVSPNGEWIAYTSDESGTWEVYVQPFPSTGGKWQISTGGGAEPRWSRDGKQLFFIGGNRALLVATVSARGSGLEVGAATALFDMPILGPLAGRTAWQRYYAVASDAQRFLIKAGNEETSSSPLTVVVNWTSALGR